MSPLALPNGQHLPMIQIQPVIQFLFPLFCQIYGEAVKNSTNFDAAAKESMEAAKAGFREMGFEWTGALNCKQVET